jgi:hypothetical protein
MKSVLKKAIILALLNLCISSSVCYAMQPTIYGLNVYVKNLDTTNYYLDILIEADDEYYNSFNEKYDLTLKDSELYKYRDNKWMAYFIRGGWGYTRNDLVGKNTFESNVRLHDFSSMFIVNSNIKAIVEDMKGNLYISSNYIKFDGSSSYIFDVKSGKLQKINPYYEMYINRNFNYLAVFVSLLFIIIIKFLISIPFKIKPKFKVVLISASTQISIQAIILILYFLTLFNYIFMGFIVSSLLILLLEFILYKKFTIHLNPKILCVFVILSNLITSIMSYGVHIL